ncbi:gastrula zinc finger protein xFG20-1-like [Rhagoletis pomonella]|uniref:gastrula zinc finger protein xFG20-1-like n=1 Tax=Rhagoletis pomonella TaxID=28610 RepID=UPI00177D01BD|nr:gastrula zinc finger protein xFG20-1-like [Rhagoletis pomonella]
MSSSYGSSGSSGHNDFANPRLESHMTFVCPECGVEFESQQDWRRHLNEEHDYIHKTPADFDFKEISESFHECQVCHKWVANANQAIALLQYHRFLHLPFNRTYRCRHCKGGFTRKRALCEHLYRFHSRQIIMVEKMRQIESETTTNVIQTAEQKLLRDPRLNREFYLRFICPQCGKNIDRYEQWLKHLDTHPSTSHDLRMHRISGSRNHYCLQCRKLLYTNEQPKLQRHRFTHLPFRLFFKCTFCMVKKSFKSEIFRHFVYAHPRHFNEAKSYIKKPVEWGAKINDRLNTELDAILRRYKVIDSTEEMDPANDNKRGRQQKKQTYASEKARLAAKQQRFEQEQRQKNSECADTAIRRSNVRIIKDNDKVSKSYTITPTESTTEDDFEELCADVFESIEEESQPMVHNGAQNKSDAIVENFKQEKRDEEEVIICIEIDTVDDDNDPSTQTNNFIWSPPRKRLKLCQSETSAHSTKQTAVQSHGHKYNLPIANKSNKNALLEENIHYLCPECGSEFNEQSSWRRHVFTEHNIENAIQTNFQMLENQQSYLCLDCMDVQHTTKHADLQRHRFMHMPFQSYLKCKFCSKTKSSKPKMMQHLQDCHVCQGNNSTNQVVEGDSNSVDVSAELYPCKLCSKYFTTKERLQLHRTQTCGVRANGLQRATPGGNTTSQNNNTNAAIANNMKLLAHLKQAHARMKRMLANDTN